MRLRRPYRRRGLEGALQIGGEEVGESQPGACEVFAQSFSLQAPMNGEGRVLDSSASSCQLKGL